MRQARILNDLMDGEVGVVIMSESLETLIENLKSFITDQVVNYKLALTVHECRHEAMMYEVTCEKCDEDAIVFADRILLPDGTEESNDLYIDGACDCKAYYSLSPWLRKSYKLIRFNPCPVGHPNVDENVHVHEQDDSDSDDGVSWEGRPLQKKACLSLKRRTKKNVDCSVPPPLLTLPQACQR